MPIVTIYQGVFHSGEEVAKKSAELLGCQCVSREVLLEASRRYGMPEWRLYEVVEREPQWWERWMENLQPYKSMLQAALCELAQGGNLVYHGHLGHELLAGVGHVLKVLLTAPKEFRIEEIKALKGFNEAAALRYIDKVDKVRSRRVMTLFGTDWRDLSRYNLIINMAQISVEGASRLIVEASRLRDFQPTPATTQAFQDLTVTARVQSALLMSPTFRNLTIDVQVKQGQVQLSGFISPLVSVLEIIRLVERVPGVARVETDFQRIPEKPQGGVL